MKEDYTRLDECRLCGVTNWLHKLDCPKPTKILQETDMPQEFRTVMWNGNFYKIQRILALECYRCGRLRTYTNMITGKDTKNMGVGYKKGDIFYSCFYCNQPGDVELIDEKKVLIDEALELERE